MNADAFLADVIENPDDDTPRLVFADWLEEQGDAASAGRAEFIRLQIERARQTPYQPGQKYDLPPRESQLLDKHGKAWLRAWRRRWTSRLTDHRYHRAFVTEGAFPLDVFLER